jgi:biopolymer transport protein ExbD
MSMSQRARRMAEHHTRHRADAQLNLIPLIDILSVMVAFLLVYSTEQRHATSRPARSRSWATKPFRMTC